MEEKNKLSIFLLIGIGIISVLLIILTMSVTVEKEYTFLTPQLDFNQYSQEEEFVIITLSNKNGLFPKRVELEPIIGCIYEKETNRLLDSRRLEITRRYGSFASDVFDLREEFVDVPANSQINISYSAYIYRNDFETIANKSIQVKYKKVLDKSQYYPNTDSVCRGSIYSEQIYP